MNSLMQKPPRCANPSACSMINSSLHANVILQPGDSLRLTFDLDSTSSDISTTSTASSIEIPATTTNSAVIVTTPSEDMMPVDNPTESTHPVLLKRIPRQSPIVASTPTSVSSSPSPAPLPIQKSNVVAERIRLMAQSDSSSDTTTSTTGS